MAADSTSLPSRCIVHADLDAFYASVEQLDRPELTGKPVLVGGSPQGRGVVAACSYEARAFGIHSAMPMKTAIRLCPQAIIVHPRFSRYHELSTDVMEILRAASSVLEQVSIDEAYMEMGAAWPWPLVGQHAKALKYKVRDETGLVISLGAGSSKSIAKIASGIGKPDGLVTIPPGAETGFLAPLPVRKLGGIGPRTEERLASLGVRTLGDLAAKDDAWLFRLFGKRGPELGRMSRGVDDREVIGERDAKSVSAESTFSQDIADPAQLHQAVDRLCRRVAVRLAEGGLRGRTVTMKLRLSDFTTFTRSATVTLPIGDAAGLLPVAAGILTRELDRRRGARFRLLGVGVSAFVSPEQLRLL